MTDSPSEPVSRRLTLRAIIRAAMDRDVVSRSELARATGLSKQTMSEAFRELESGGWLEQNGRTQGSVGRSATTFRLSPRRALVFGADVGGTKIRAAVTDMTGTVIEERTEPTDGRGGDYVIAQLDRLSEVLAAKADVALERILVGSIGVPGAFDHRSGRLAMVPNIEGLGGDDFRDRLQSRLRFDVQIDNDVNMAARGEQWCGEGKGLANFVFIALGTGIGMGIINDGRILQGSHGAAGEISTLPIGADAFDSRTFKSGALETMIGAAAIRDRYHCLGGVGAVDVREIMDRVRREDALAIATIDEVARNLAVAILAIAAVLDPERVILGGSIGERPELLERVRRALALCMSRPPSCTISRLGNRAGLYGAVAHGLDHLRQTLFELPVWARAEGPISARAGVG